mmetsp:Transcript_2134/g.2986  ORF Transcript_2134/g.2986 Transcript_2134/m.2986 type:complete len:95 (+) Transcript_2134:979-1263(+)
MVKSLQAKLDDAVSKISELTDVLAYLSPEYTTEAYYEESAAQAMAPLLSAGNNQYTGGSTVGGAAGKNADLGYQKTAMGKSDFLTNSQVTQRRN